MDCPRCHQSSPRAFRFCGHCGTAFAVAGEAGDGAERRHLTVMFCDLVGSTSLSSRLDPEDFQELIRRYLEVAGAEIKRCGGFIGKVLGDGLLVYFGYPKAHEDAPAMGVRAALAVGKAIAGVKAHPAAEAPDSLQVRIGLHTGLLIIGELSGGDHHERSAVVGQTPNVAARLQMLAEPGTVLISGDLYRLVVGAFRCRSLGPVSLKGLDEPVEIYEVLGETERSRVMAAEDAAPPMIGRRKELALLEARWARVKEKKGELALIRGEAGMGKSRLLAQFHRRIHDTPHHWMELQSAEKTAHSPLHPLLQLLRHELALASGGTTSEKLARLEGWSTAHALPVPETTTLLAAALGLADPDEAQALSPAAIRARLIAWFPLFLSACAALAPVVLAVEDLHWLDASTLETLRCLAEQPVAGLLVLGTARPEFQKSWLADGVIELTRLDDSEVRGLVEMLAGERELTPEIARQVARKSNGVPLFVEEMTRMALGAAPLPSGRTRGPLAIPNSLHALLMARLHRTTNNPEVAQMAAVFGGEFEYAMIRQLSSLSAEQLDSELSRLVEAGLLAQRGEIPHATFGFCHALIQEEAYQSLLLRKRRHYHEKIARIFESQAPAMRAARPELVAQHFSGAGRTAEAVEYWHLAAEQAALRMASHEALASADRGLELLSTLPAAEEREQQEIALLLVQAWALTLHRGFAAPQVEAAYGKVQALLHRLNDPSHVLLVAPSLFGFHIATANLPAAQRLAEEMIRAGERTGDEGLLGQGWFSAGVHAYYSGTLELAQRNFATALSTLGPGVPNRYQRTLDPRIGSLGWGALTLLLRGFPDQALEWVQRACERAEELRHPHYLAFARQFTFLVHHWSGEPARLLENMEDYLSHCREQGFGFWQVCALLLQLWAQGMIAPTAGIMGDLQRGMASWQRTAVRIAAAQHYGAVAEVALRLGLFDEASAALTSGRESVRQTGEQVYAPQLDLLDGLLWAERDPERAEASLRTALAGARGCGARWHELRAALSLARLLHGRGLGGEARAELAPIAEWFTEGAALASLREARALLARLS